MAGLTLERLVQTSELKTTIWKRSADKSSRPLFAYNNRVDTITLLVTGQREPTIAHYIDDHVALLYQPDTLEVIGVRVEAFKRSFLPMYARLEKAWKLSDQCSELEDLGDLIIAVKKQEHIMATEVSKITSQIAETKGLALPVPA